ncbi:MAG: hypothetical protein N2035_09965 [Chthoniobacterales bacterium]|nr:hypothetical protein [Chthoniobacterales bacterium]
MRTSYAEPEKLNLLLELMREARSQLEAGGQPCLGGFLKERGLSPEQIKEFVEEWTGIISDLMQDLLTEKNTHTVGQLNLQTGIRRGLFAHPEPDFAKRL